MKKLFKHACQILVGGLIVALFASIDLNDYPMMQYVDYIFWPMCVFFLMFILFYNWRHKACLIFLLLLLSSSAFAGEHTAEICSYYRSYKARIEQYEADRFKKDEACDTDMWDKARTEAEQYKISLADVATFGASYIGKKGAEWYDGSCANDLMSMCSEYERRHPEAVTKTVPYILNEPVGKLQSNGRATSCWPCDMVYVVFTVVQGLSSNLSGMMSSIAFIALIWGTVFWLLFKALGMVLTSKGGTYFSQIASGLIFVMLAAWILKDNGKNLSWLYSKFLSPVMQLGMVISEDIQDAVGAESAAFSALTGSSEPFYKQVESQSASQVTSSTDFMDYCSYPTSPATEEESTSDIFSNWYSGLSSKFFPSLGTKFKTLTTEASKEGSSLLDDDLKSKFLCITQKYYNQSRPFIATGQSLISFGSHNTKPFDTSSTRFPSMVKMWVMGALLVCLFTYFGFLVAFRIIDIFLRLGFILVLMPLFVVTSVFPITREYTLKAWKFLFGIIVEFIGLSVSINFIMILLEGVVMPESNELLEAMTAEYSADYGDNLFNAVTKNMTWAFPLLLICVVFLGEKLMKSFPIVIASLFDVHDSSAKGSQGTMMGSVMKTATSHVMSVADTAKNTAKTVAQNPYKTKETKAKEAEKNLRNKIIKLNEEKRKPNNQKNIAKAQKEVDEARMIANAFRAQADAEKDKTAPSRSGYAARRFGYDSGNAVRRGGGAAAEAVEKFGSKVGGVLMKNGLGAIVGVPLVLGAKTLSTGIRIGAKTAEVGLKAAGRAGATVQKLGNKITGRAPPPRRPRP